MFDWISPAIDPEVLALVQQYGTPLYQTVTAPFTDYLRREIAPHRQCDVCMVIRRGNGKLITMTKTFYPPNIYRLPTGGIEAGETILAALQRETLEETGLVTSIERFLAVVTYEHAGEPIFASFVFLLQEISGKLGALDEHEQVAAYREIMPNEIETLAEQLEQLGDGYSAELQMRWADWGAYRAALHRVVSAAYRAMLDEVRADNERYKAEWTSRSTDDLIQALIAEQDGPEEEGFYTPLFVLHMRGTQEVFDRAQALCLSQDAHERQAGADILGQLGSPSKESFHESAIQLLLTMLENEQDPDALCSVATALGHRHDPRAIPLLVQLRHHPHEDVRFGVAFGLCDVEDERAIAALIELSADPDEDVRDWATFGLGSRIEVDTPEIRNALLARVTDEHVDTRAEAIEGLIRRHDPHCVEIILAALADSERCGSLILKAAETLGDPRFYPALFKIQEECANDDDIHASWRAALNDAVIACQPTER